MKDNSIFLLHFPPPIHGSAIVGLSIKESELINQTFDSRYINLLASKEIDETGKVTFRKMIGFGRIWLKLLSELINNVPNRKSKNCKMDRKFKADAMDHTTTLKLH